LIRPGSNPEYGNAEPKEYLYQTLKQLKESNCVFTRFHWQQDEAVYDWCDRNGMLIQEEIPHWGKVNEMPEKQQMDVSKQQIDEMMASHYNHPSIIMWGMGNELYGQSLELHEFVRELKGYIKQFDAVRPINYVTNTIFNGPSKDATSIGDILMINEYIGTWHGNLDEVKELEKIIKANPNRSLVISEFGLCEPAFAGGDKARCELFKRKMKIYSKFPEISGIINFCLNDYRTQMGEEGRYQFRRRVHGSTDIFGEPKPSYYVVQDYCSPIKVEELQKNLGEITIRLSVKDTLPSYLVDGYEIFFYKCGKVIGKRKIPPLKPGEQCQVSLGEQANLIQIVRTNGFLVKEIEVNRV
jgi:beta-glucuronidase